jgi:hypothetical protein
VDAVSNMLKFGMQNSLRETTQAASLALTTLTTDVERDGTVHEAIDKAGTVAICLEALKFATTIEDGFIITYVVHPLGSLTYDDDNHIPQSVNVRSQIVKGGGVNELVCALRKVEDADAQYLIALLLGNLACDTVNKDRILDANAITGILGTMVTHQKDSRVQDNSINVLRNLSVHHQHSLRKMKNEGALEVLQQALRDHEITAGYRELAVRLVSQLGEVH